jgi:hypothetical protein
LLPVQDKLAVEAKVLDECEDGACAARSPATGRAIRSAERRPFGRLGSLAVPRGRLSRPRPTDTSVQV